MSALRMLDVVIGLTFVFLLISLICTAIQELLEAWLKYRAIDLERGIRELLGSDNTSDYLKRIYSHGLVNGLFRGTYEEAKNKKELPSYIPARLFALALMDIVMPGTSGQSGAAGADKADNPNAADKALPLAAFRKQVEKIQAPIQLRDALLALTDAAGHDAVALRTNIENWYNGAMDRVAGWYKRRAQVVILGIGLMIAIGINADAIAVFKSLTNDSALRDSVVAAAASYKPSGSASDLTSEQAKAILDGTLTQLEALKLPIGWDWEDDATALAAKTTAKKKEAEAADTRDKKKAIIDTAKDAAAKVGKLKSAQVSVDMINTAQNNAGTAIAPTKSPLTAADNAQGYADKADANATDKIRISNKKLAIPSTPGGWLQKVFGLLITGIAVSLGAPFWFDVLNKFMVVRSTVKPHEKSLEEGSEDRQSKKNK